MRISPFRKFSLSARSQICTNVPLLQPPKSPRDVVPFNEFSPLSIPVSPQPSWTINNVDRQSDQHQTASNVSPQEKAQAPPIRDRVMPVSPPLATVVIHDSVRKQFDYLDNFTPCPSFENEEHWM
jgi:hypothetical protein